MSTGGVSLFVDSQRGFSGLSWRLVLGVAVLLIAGVFLPLSAHGGIEWRFTEVDLGMVYRDEPQKMSFGFVNTSDETVYVFDIEPSCDCSTAQALPPAVPPHSTGEVLVFFDPMGYEGRGRINEYIRLSTSDGEDLDAELRFSVEVTTGPEAEPRAIRFGSICKGESDSTELHVRPGDRRDLEILSVSSESDCVKVVPKRVLADGSQEFTVVACNLDCRGAISTYIDIATNDSIRPEIRVPVTANLMGTITIEPEVIAFGPTLPGKLVAQPVRIYCSEGLPFKITRITCTANSIECSIETADRNAYELKMKIKNDAPAGRVTGQIVVETDCSTQPLITADLTGYVRRID
jgi:hypothetical protein